MSRRTLVTVLVGVAFVALAGWIAANTFWVDIKVPMPPRGAAAENPFYGAQRLAAALGATSERDRTLNIPSTSDVLVLSAWDWSLSPRQRSAIERWVEGGGRLVVDPTVARDREFQRWSGIVLEIRSPGRGDTAGGLTGRCFAVQEVVSGTTERRLRTTYQLCGAGINALTVAPRERLTWSLRDTSDGVRAARVAIGQGSVTVLAASIVRLRELLDGDHGFIFTSATQLRRGDRLHFLTESDYPPLLALIWREGSSAIALALAALALALWRGGVRFGPLAAPPAQARRSLAEQILGSGRFALERGDGAALHAAAVRALFETARRRIPGFSRVTGSERVAAIAHAIDAGSAAGVTALPPAPATGTAAILESALQEPPPHRPDQRRRGIAQSIALIEAARRRLLIAHTRSPHGTK